jgi:ubiquinone/menaquinone biosynthesis C-methylase UbiE
MPVVYSKLARDKSSDRPDEWQYFGSRLVELVGVSAGNTVLDVGTGPGSVLFPASKKTGDQGQIIGIDIDFDWFRFITPKIQDQNLNSVSFAHMDVGQLGFEEDTFDRVFCGNLGWDYCFDFWQMEFIGPDIWLAEISRVLKPGGRLGISSWAGREDIDWFGALFKMYFPEYIVDWENKEGSLFRVYRENAEAYRMILKEGGFQDVEVIMDTEVFVSKDEEEWWGQVWGSFWWQYIDPVEKSNPKKMNQFKEMIFSELDQFKYYDGIRMNKTAVFALGTNRK